MNPKTIILVGAGGFLVYYFFVRKTGVASAAPNAGTAGTNVAGQKQGLPQPSTSSPGYTLGGAYHDSEAPLDYSPAQAIQQALDAGVSFVRNIFSTGNPDAPNADAWASTIPDSY